MRNRTNEARSLKDRKEAREALKSRVAELMSIGLDTVQIRTRMGMNNAAIQRVISEIRKDLGWQAR